MKSTGSSGCPNWAGSNTGIVGPSSASLKTLPYLGMAAITGCLSKPSEKSKKRVHPATGEIGLDLGVKRLYTLSNGDYHEYFNIEPLAKQLILTQHTLSRRIKFSANWHKQKRQSNQLHICMANTRLDTLHKATTTNSQNHAMIYVEDLMVIR